MSIAKNNFGCLKVILITGLLLMLIFEVQAVSDRIISAQSYAEKSAIKSMGGCNYRWDCNEWSSCLNRKQTRICTNIGTCPERYKTLAEERKCMPKLPGKLFDIELELEKPVISDPGELTAWVSFESFSTEAIPVDLTYIILNELGNEVYSEIEGIVVYREEFLIKGFSDLNLEPGKYNLLLIIKYADVTEEFKHYFEIEEKILVSGFTISKVTTIVETPSEEEFIKRVEECNYKWDCTEWSGCVNRKQTRICTNIGTCPGTYRKPAEEQRCMPKLPAQLFDIKLELEDNKISDSNELTAWVSFESFGTEPTPADLTYIILDESGNEVYSEIGDVVVYTEEFVIKKFDNSNLGFGKYILGLSIEYANITEEFKQDFEIKERSMAGAYYSIGFVALIALFFVLMKFESNRKKKEKVREEIGQGYLTKKGK